MHQNVLLILTVDVICTLLILNMLTLILEMCCSINTGFIGSQVFPMFNSCLEEIYIVWRVAMQSLESTMDNSM